MALPLARRLRRVALTAIGTAPVLLVGVGAGVADMATAPSAGAAVTCAFDQITQHTGSANVFAPSINADGNRIAFSGGASFDGNPNPGNNEELWIYEVSSDTLARLTDDASGISFQQQINDAGDHIAFATTANLGGTNANGNFEVYQWTESPPGISPITTTSPPVGHGNPSQDASGDLVAYVSTADGNAEVFLHDANAVGPDTQITNTTGPTVNAGPVLDDAGNRLAYASSIDGNFEVYVRNRSAGTTAKLTSTGSGTSVSPAISDDGTRVTFTSNRNLTGGNADQSFEVFQTVLATGVTTQLSSGPNTSAPVHPLRSNVNGSRVVFQDARDLTGANADGSDEIFLRDAGGSGVTTQLTNSLVASTDPSVDESGTHVAFLSSADPFGENVDGNTEVFLATCPAPSRPDARIGTTATTGPFKGNDVYGTSPAASQTKTAGVARGATRTFYVSAQNDSTGTETLTLEGVESGSPGYTVRYLQGSTDITGQVHAGTFTLNSVVPGASVVVKVKITATNAAASGSARNATVTVRSATTHAAKDVVRARAERT